MAEGDLIASQFLRNIEEGLTAIPGAEEAGIGVIPFFRHAGIPRFAYFHIPHDKRNTGLGAERLEVTEVRVVIALFDTHMERCDLKTGFVDLRACA